VNAAVRDDELPPQVAEMLVRLERQLAQEHLLGGGTASAATTHLLQGAGKRIRPTLVFLSSAVVGNSIPDGVCSAAKAIELIHTATLHHDDVMDRGMSRRGLRSVNSIWGNRTAVLSGDYLLATSTATLGRLGDDVNRRVSAAVNAVIEGQLREMQSAGTLDLSLERYFDIITRKTAALFELSCWLGATLGGGTTEQAAVMAQFGQQLGIAYQIVDDVLDVVGTSAVLGKEPLADLRLGVLTLPVLLALRRRFSGTTGPDIRGWLGTAELTGAEAIVIDELRRSGALVDSYQCAVAACARAGAALATLASGTATDSLTTIADLILERGAPFVHGDHGDPA
jgi:heptaprenyl diphosphate synthase